MSGAYPSTAARQDPRGLSFNSLITGDEHG
jgi:hypothetical protein